MSDHITRDGDGNQLVRCIVCGEELAVYDEHWSLGREMCTCEFHGEECKGPSAKANKANKATTERKRRGSKKKKSSKETPPPAKKPKIEFGTAEQRKELAAIEAEVDASDVEDDDYWALYERRDTLLATMRETHSKAWDKRFAFWETMEDEETALTDPKDPYKPQNMDFAKELEEACACE